MAGPCVRWYIAGNDDDGGRASHRAQHGGTGKETHGASEDASIAFVDFVDVVDSWV